MKNSYTQYDFAGNNQRSNFERGDSGNGPSIIWTLLYTSFYLFSAIPLVIGIAYVMVITGSPATSIKLITGELIYSVQIIVAISIAIILIKKYEQFLLTFGWREKLSQILNKGLKWATPIIVVYSILFLAFYIHPSPEAIFSSIQTRIAAINDIESINELALFSVLAIIGVFTEEMIWRGLIIGKLRLFFSDKKSVIISAVLFSFSHFIIFNINIEYLLYLFFCGFLYGFAYLSTNSCISAMVPHFLNNFLYMGYLWLVFLQRNNMVNF